jgi:hypothetical protein
VNRVASARVSERKFKQRFGRQACAREAKPDASRREVAQISHRTERAGRRFH